MLCHLCLSTYRHEALKKPWGFRADVGDGIQAHHSYGSTAVHLQKQQEQLEYKTIPKPSANPGTYPSTPL